MVPEPLVDARRCAAGRGPGAHPPDQPRPLQAGALGCDGVPAEGPEAGPPQTHRPATPLTAFAHPADAPVGLARRAILRAEPRRGRGPADGPRRHPRRHAEHGRRLARRRRHPDDELRGGEKGHRRADRPLRRRGDHGATARSVPAVGPRQPRGRRTAQRHVDCEARSVSQVADAVECTGDLARRVEAGTSRARGAAGGHGQGRPRRQ